MGARNMQSRMGHYTRLSSYTQHKTPNCGTPEGHLPAEEDIAHSSGLTSAADTILRETHTINTNTDVISSKHFSK